MIDDEWMKKLMDVAKQHPEYAVVVFERNTTIGEVLKQLRLE